MKLDRVTITGADDTVAPGDLFAIADRFPFVEWGILISQGQLGTPRFPSSSWLLALKADAAARPGVRFALHLCGRWLRELVAVGEAPPLRSIQPIFRRIQLNFHGEAQKVSLGFPDALGMMGIEEVIFQIDGVSGRSVMEAAAKAAPTLYRCVPLFDMSHGAGVLPAAWPAPIDPAGYQGYAGGLGPDNLADQLPKIDAAAGDARVWIDMETRVRSSNDRIFDLAKVRRCLEIAEDFVAR